MVNGVCLSKSNISGKYILSGRACSIDDSLINANQAIMSHNAGYEVAMKKEALGCKHMLPPPAKLNDRCTLRLLLSLQFSDVLH